MTGSTSLTASWREAHMKELVGELDQQGKVLAATPGKQAQWLLVWGIGLSGCPTTNLDRSPYDAQP